MVKIYRVIQIKSNQLVQENVRTITDIPTKRIYRYHSNKHFSQLLPTRWRQNQLAKIRNKITSLSPDV